MVKGLATGRYQLEFTPCTKKITGLAGADKPGAVRVAAPHAVTGVDFRLQLAGQVTGTVLGGTSPLVNVCAIFVSAPSNGFFGSDFTGPQGHYRAAHLAPGKYKVEFSAGCGDSGFASQWWAGARSAPPRR